MSKKKEEELQAIKDVSRPAIDAISMKQPKDQTDEEWLDVKAKAKAEGRNVSDAEYETRYQALLKRYNIKPENYETSSGGAATYYEEGKKDSQSEKQGKAPTEQKKAPTEQKKAPTEQKKAPTEQKKASSKPTKSKTSTESNTASKGTKTPPPQYTGRAQTSKTGSNIPPKNDGKKPPKKDEKNPPKNVDKTPTISDSEQRSYHKPAMEQIADNKPPTHMKHYRGKDLSEVNPISTYIKNSAAKGRQQMEERSIKRRTDVSKYSSQSTSKETKETKKKQGKVLTGVTNDDIRSGRSPLTIQAQQTKKKSPLDTILDKEKKKKFKYKQ